MPRGSAVGSSRTGGTSGSAWRSPVRHAWFTAASLARDQSGVVALDERRDAQQRTDELVAPARGQLILVLLERDDSVAHGGLDARDEVEIGARDGVECTL